MINNRRPVIKQALGSSWDELSDIVKQHYDITPGVPSNMMIKGFMNEVYHSPIAKLFLMPARLFGALVPYRGQNIATEVRNWKIIRDGPRFLGFLVPLWSKQRKK